MRISDWSSDVCSSDLNCHAKDVQLSSTGHNSAARLSPYATEQFFMRHALTAALLATTMACLPDTAHAQAMSAEEAAALRAELASLRAKVETLEARLDAATIQPVPSARSVAAAPA